VSTLERPRPVATVQLTDIALGFVEATRDAGGELAAGQASVVVGEATGYAADEVQAGLDFALAIDLFWLDPETNHIHTRWSRHQ
jgi:hypothetical protein